MCAQGYQHMPPPMQSQVYPTCTGKGRADRKRVSRFRTARVAVELPSVTPPIAVGSLRLSQTEASGFLFPALKDCCAQRRGFGCSVLPCAPERRWVVARNTCLQWRVQAKKMQSAVCTDL